MDSSAHTTQERRVRVFCVNDQPILLEALRRFFLYEPWAEHVGDAIVDQKLGDKVTKARPDVVVLDPGRHVDADLADLVSELRACAPGVGIVVFLLFGSSISEKYALAAGADAFVAKDGEVNELLAAIRRVARPA
jgi:two-component system response regulator DesR